MGIFDDILGGIGGLVGGATGFLGETVGGAVNLIGGLTSELGGVGGIASSVADVLGGGGGGGGEGSKGFVPQENSQLRAAAEFQTRQIASQAAERERSSRGAQASVGQNKQSLEIMKYIAKKNSSGLEAAASSLMSVARSKSTSVQARKERLS